MYFELVSGSSEKFNPKVQHTIIFSVGIFKFKTFKKDSYFLPSV
jgi:hypothetical protein